MPDNLFSGQEAAPITLHAQIMELRRELRMRETAYPRWIDSGRLSQDTADRRNAALRAALATLEAVQSRANLGAWP